MAAELIHDRGRGPELVGTRITVYNLLPELLDASMTEAEICRINDLTPEQVAAVRAYVLNHADEVLSEHMRIEDRLSAGNPPDTSEKLLAARQRFLSFRDWLAKKNATAPSPEQPGGQSESLAPLPSFRQWLADQEPHSGASL